MGSGYSSGQFMSFGGQGQNVDVDTAAEALAAATENATAVVIKAHPDNTDVVYFNMVPGVAATAANGYPLSAGQDSPWLPVPDKDLANISVIADSVDQKIAYVYVT